MLQAIKKFDENSTYTSAISDTSTPVEDPGKGIEDPKAGLSICRGCLITTIGS